jgi:peroxiredoxin
MKSLVFALLLALQAQTGVQTGTVAPNVGGFAIQGSTVNLSQFKGKKPVLVVFYRTQG